MGVETLAEALEREHHEIDEGLETFTATPASSGPSAEALYRAIGALRRHIYLEEEFVFPPMRGGGEFASVIVMLREHGNIWNILDAIEVEVRAGGTAAQLCHELAIALLHHNSKEERIIYSRVDDVLNATAAGELRTFIDTGEMPPGWVCARA